MSATAKIQAQTFTYLKHKDIEHLQSEGFGSDDITQMQKGGMRSLTQAEAETMGFRVKGPDGKWQSSPGLYFQFTNTFGQLRADNPPLNSKGKLCKYLTPSGAKSQAWLPDGCKVITEGFKDAAAGTLRGGVPTGTLAGVSHYRKALPEGAGHMIVFDADGWENPGVFTNLVHAGKYLKGRIQLIPAIEGEPKAGLCEYFKAGHTTKDYKALLASAMKPEAFILSLPDHWKSLPKGKQSNCARAVLVLAAKYLQAFEQEQLVDTLRKVTGISSKTLRRQLDRASLRQARQKHSKERKQQKQTEPEPIKQQGLIPITSHPETGAPILPASSLAANILSEHYRSTLAFNLEQQEFYRYASEFDGQWSHEPLEFVRGMIAAALNASGASDIYSSSYVTSVCDLMKYQLAVRRWNETRTNLLPMRNGVLEVATGEFLDHSPGYRFLWQLPYAYNPLATCQPIQEWLLQAQDGDPQRVQLLRAYLKAIVTGCTDLQRYLECLGPGGTGKGTYTKLAIALVGLENTCITELKLLEGNRFETSGIYGKRLVVVNDSDRYGGSVSVLKAMTGQDPLRNEQKHKQQGTGFVPTALVLVAANEAIQSNDYTSGLERRRLTIPFLNQVAASQRRNLLTITGTGMSGEFVDYLPGLLNWVLALPDAAVRELLVNTPVSVPSLAQWKAESLLESNPIAEWLDNRVILAAGEKTYVGCAEKIRETSGEPGHNTSRDRYPNSDRWLYPSYVQYCQQVGNRPISLKRFVGLLEDLLRSQLGLPITRGRDRHGSFFGDIAIRAHKDEGSPRPITKDLDDDARVVVNVTGCDGAVMAPPPVDVRCDGCDGLFNLNIEEAEELHGEEAALRTFSLVPPNCESISSQNPSQPSHSTLPGVSAVAADAPPIIRPITTAATTHHLPKLPHAFESDHWRTDSDPFWYGLAASAGTSTVTRKHRALQIRKEWLSVKSAEALKQSKQKWSHEAKFVWNRVLTCAEQRQLEALSQSQQTSIDGFDDVWDEV